MSFSFATAVIAASDADAEIAKAKTTYVEGLAKNDLTLDITAEKLIDTIRPLAVAAVGDLDEPYVIVSVYGHVANSTSESATQGTVRHDYSSVGVSVVGQPAPVAAAPSDAVEEAGTQSDQEIASGEPETQPSA